MPATNQKQIGEWITHRLTTPEPPLDVSQIQRELGWKALKEIEKEGVSPLCRFCHHLKLEASIPHVTAQNYQYHIRCLVSERPVTRGQFTKIIAFWPAAVCAAPVVRMQPANFSAVPFSVIQGFPCRHSEIKPTP